MVEEYERNGLTVTINYDETPENPRDWENFGVMICAHKRYEFGEEQFDPEEFVQRDGKGLWENLKQYLVLERDASIILPLGVYDHSGVTMYVGDKHDKWDGGQVGFIYATSKRIDDEFNGDAELAEKALRGEVEMYDQFLTGQVYGYSVVNPNNGKIIDSLYGVYGLELTREVANQIADEYVHPHEAAYAKKASTLHG